MALVPMGAQGLEMGLLLKGLNHEKPGPRDQALEGTNGYEVRSAVSDDLLESDFQGIYQEPQPSSVSGH